MTGRNRFVQRWLVLAGIACAASANASTITVDNLGDTDEDGNGCTLREAIQNANGDDTSGSTDCAAGSGIDLIEFSASGTVSLGGALPGLTDADETQIDGAGRAITIAGTGSANVFTVVASAAL